MPTVREMVAPLGLKRFAFCLQDLYRLTDVFILRINGPLDVGHKTRYLMRTETCLGRCAD